MPAFLKRMVMREGCEMNKSAEMYGSRQTPPNDMYAGAFYRQLVEKGPAPMIGIGAGGAIMFWNDGSRRLYGYTAVEMIGRPFTSLTPAGRVKEIWGRLAEAEKTGRPIEYETVHLDRYGGEIEVAVLHTPVLIDDVIVGVAAYVRPVAEQSAMERILQRRAGFLDSVINSFSYPMFVVDARNMTIEIMNDKARELYGADGKTCYTLKKQGQSPFDRGGELCPVDIVRRTSRPAIVEKSKADSNGVQRCMMVQGFPVAGGGGGGENIVVSSIDTTASKRTEDLLRKSEQRYRDLVENINEVLVTLNMEGIITYVSPAVQSMLGYAPEEIVGQFITYFVAEDDLPAFVDSLQNREGSESNSRDFRFVTKDGRIGWFNISSHRSIDMNGVHGTNCVLIDITERKELEMNIERLRREQEALLRHELKNILAPIQGFSELLMHMSANGLDEKQRSFLTYINDSTRKAVRMIDDLKKIQDIEQGRFELDLISFPLKMVVESAVDTVRLQAAYHDVTISFVNEAGMALTPMDIILLPGVFHNLIKNAVEHVCDLGDESQKEVAVRMTKKMGKIVVTINNRGDPIPPERIAVFFDKFNTERKKKGGTGLGTSYAYLVTQAHGGDISVQSNAAEGTTVTLMFREVEEEEAVA